MRYSHCVTLIKCAEVDMRLLYSLTVGPTLQTLNGVRQYIYSIVFISDANG